MALQATREKLKVVQPAKQIDDRLLILCGAEERGDAIVRLVDALAEALEKHLQRVVARLDGRKELLNVRQTRGVRQERLLMRAHDRIKATIKAIDALLEASKERRNIRSLDRAASVFARVKVGNKKLTIHASGKRGL